MSVLIGKGATKLFVCWSVESLFCTEVAVTIARRVFLIPPYHANLIRPELSIFGEYYALKLLLMLLSPSYFFIYFFLDPDSLSTLFSDILSECSSLNYAKINKWNGARLYQVVSLHLGIRVCVCLFVWSVSAMLSNFSKHIKKIKSLHVLYCGHVYIMIVECLIEIHKTRPFTARLAPANPCFVVNKNLSDHSDRVMEGTLLSSASRTLGWLVRIALLSTAQWVQSNLS